MNYSDFTIEIRSKADFLAEVRKDLGLIESGRKEEEHVDRVYFESIDAANRLLTPKRVELLRRLHDSGAMNTNELAKQLSRDYQNVRQDVLALAEVGLIIKEGRLITAPWRKVTMELTLAA